MDERQDVQIKAPFPVLQKELHMCCHKHSSTKHTMGPPLVVGGVGGARWPTAPLMPASLDCMAASRAQWPWIGAPSCRRKLDTIQSQKFSIHRRRLIASRGSFHTKIGLTAHSRHEAPQLHVMIRCDLAFKMQAAVSVAEFATNGCTRSVQHMDLR